MDPERVILSKSCAIVASDGPFRDHTEIPARGTPGEALLRIVFVGNDWERKGGPRLLRWHQERWKETAELHVCSRTAPQDRSLKNVIWHGATDRATLLNEVLPSMDMMVMPTRIDTFLIAAQEAQGAGLPVITSRIAGLPEVVRHGRTGLLCRFDQDEEFIAAIQSLLTDHALRRRMGVAAREFAMTNLTANLWHDHLFDQLTSLVDGKPIQYAPPGIDIRRSDAERINPRTAFESLQATEVKL